MYFTCHVWLRFLFCGNCVGYTYRFPNNYTVSIGKSKENKSAMLQEGRNINVNCKLLVLILFTVAVCHLRLKDMAGKLSSENPMANPSHKMHLQLHICPNILLLLCNY